MVLTLLSTLNGQGWISRCHGHPLCSLLALKPEEHGSDKGNQLQPTYLAFHTSTALYPYFKHPTQSPLRKMA